MAAMVAAAMRQETAAYRGLLRVVIVAREAIAPGGQVLVDYGDAYWRASGVAPRPLPRILADVGTDRYRF